MIPSIDIVPSRTRSFLAAFSVAVLTMAMPTALQAERSVTLAWNPSPSTAVAGYFVYAWEENAESPIKIDARNDSHALVAGLKEGLSYTFQVTAYNAYHLESSPSEGLRYRVPVPLRMIQSGGATGSSRIQFPAAPGRWYELQASTDLVSWTTIWQTGMANNYSWMEYQDPRSRYYSRRFYRLLVH
jgi:hypothetical protein